MNRVLLRSASIFGCLLAWLAPAWLVAAESLVYELQAGSTILDDCDDCDRLVVVRPLVGTWEVPATPVPHSGWAMGIEALDLRTPDEPASYEVKGSGMYWGSRDLPAFAQQLDLNAEVNGVAGVFLTSGPLDTPADLPWIDITVTEPKPHRDPMHVFTIRIKAAPRVPMVRYEVLKGSIFLDDCLPCARPSLPIPIQGTFFLGKVVDDSLFAGYRIDGIDFIESEINGPWNLQIAGSGKYEQGGEVAVLDDMTLELDVTKTDFAAQGAILSKDRGPADAQLPSIDIQLRHKNPGSDIHVFSLHLVARPIQFRRGDANADGATDISDAVAILGHLFLGLNKVPCEQAGDANDDGALDISDAVYVLSLLFLGGKPIEPPVGSCGVDPTGHSLPCDSFPGCT